MQEYPKEFAAQMFYTPSPLVRQGGIWLLRTGANIAKPDYHIGPRTIDYYSLHFVMDGKVHYTTDSCSAALGQGDVFCLFPGTRNEYRIIPSARRLRMYWLAFDGPQAAGLLASLGITAETPYSTAIIDGNGTRSLQQLVQISQSEPAAELKLISLAYSLFASLQAGRSRRSAASANAGWIEDCIRYMDTHFTEEISIAQIAEHFKLHRSYLSAMLKERLGQPPLQYIQSLRLQKAARLLQETSLSVTVIALSAGYRDLYSFSRAFSKRFGKSPSDYRACKQSLGQCSQTRFAESKAAGENAGKQVR